MKFQAFTSPLESCTNVPPKLRADVPKYSFTNLPFLFWKNWVLKKSQATRGSRRALAVFCPNNFAAGFTLHNHSGYHHTYTSQTNNTHPFLGPPPNYFTHLAQVRSLFIYYTHDWFPLYTFYLRPCVRATTVGALE